MLTKWAAGVGTAAAVALAGQPPPTGITIPQIPVPTAGATAQPPSGPSSSEPEITLPSRTQLTIRVERDGTLSVDESITVRRGGTMNRKAPLRIAAGGDRDRVYRVRDVSIEGNGSAQATADDFSVHTGEGKSVLRYKVDGAVIDLGDRQEVRWSIASGWDARMGLLRASFIAPARPTKVVCFGGAYGSTTLCDDARLESSGITRVDMQNLNAGDRIDLVITLPSGTVPANARFEAAKTTVSAFALTPFAGFGLLAVLALLLAGAALLWAARGRDAKATATDVGKVDVLVRDNESVAFASPDGVLPGQIGTVVDERVDAVDVTATVVDLAVRNYLWIQQVEGDWQIMQRNPADHALTAYERAVYDVFATPQNVSTLPVALGPIRAAMYSDVVAREWFKRRPDRARSLWMWIGAGLAVVGAALTVVLAVTVGNALLGLAVVIAGVAVALGTRFMPSRTKRGGVLVAQVRALVQYLRETDPASIPANDRELVFSRSLPYAVVLGETPRWVQAFGVENELYWFSGGHDVPGFVNALDRRLQTPAAK
ncbi:DUF2207 family protein [Actinocrispum wychmicini]|uniref:DUF2207 family protein n=1 Tax=Actinocrispum wychmicini TaxID=1213861 RepID=UPI0014053EF3|nr:DUF2207 domain-containing protein [Actinocrispum wychmicini]